MTSIEPLAPRSAAAPRPPGPTALVLADRGELADAIASAVTRSGWAPACAPLAGVLAPTPPPWPVAVSAVVAAGADPNDLADVVDLVRHHDPAVPLVVLGDRPDGTLLGRLLARGGGRIAYGTTDDDAPGLLDRAAVTARCAASDTVTTALLDRLGELHRPHDLELAATLLTAGGRDGLVATIGARPDLLAAVVDDAAGRALKRLALDATAEERRWLALVLDG